MKRRGGMALMLFLLLCWSVAVPGARADTGAYEPHSVLVGFAPGTPEDVRARAHAAVGGEVVTRFSRIRVDVVRLADGKGPLTAAAAYEQQPGVAFAEPNWVRTLDSIPNDPRFSDEWGLHNTGQLINGSYTVGTNDADIDAPEGWDTVFGPGSFPTSGGARVGVLDSGVDLAHEDLAGKIVTCMRATSGNGSVTSGCPDDNGHGTHVAGTIGALTNNGRGVAGVAPDAELAVFKAFNSNGQAYTADVVAGIDWLTNVGSARVISMSFGGGPSSAEQSQVTASSAARVLLVAAAGNDGNTSTNYPAGYPEVMSVAAITENNGHASFSNCNADVEIAAPGTNVWSSVPGGYAYASGTSMATPHVSGIAAMVLGHSGLSASDVRTLIDNTAVDMSTAGRDSCTGYGRANLAAAVAQIGPTIVTPAEGASIASLSTTITGTASPGAAVTVAEGATTLGSPVADGAGSWSLAVTLAEGAHAVTASITGSNPITSQIRHFTLDVTAPDPPTITSPSEGATITSNIVSVAGQTEPGARVTLKEGTTVLATTTATASGSFAAQITVGSGVHGIVALARDVAGNLGTASAPRSFTVSSTGRPDPPTLTGPAQGTLVAQYFTVTGTAQADTTVLIYDGAQYIGGVVTPATGIWSVRVRASGGGPRTITATATDTNHNVSVPSGTLGVVVDMTPPTVSWTTDDQTVFLLQADLLGQTTDDHGVGTIEIVYRRSAGSTSTGTATCPSCGSPGTATFTATPDLLPGVYTAVVTAVDLVGNRSASDSVQFIVV